MMAWPRLTLTRLFRFRQRMKGGLCERFPSRAVAHDLYVLIHMILFLATVIEQPDLALEHISNRDVHNARFGLMLTDNAIELVLHQIAKDKATESELLSYAQKEYKHQSALNKALGRSFDHKVKFARLEGHLGDEAAQTVGILHSYRNEVYHVGLQHERILPALSHFYLDIVCDYLAAFDLPYLSWGSNTKISTRAQKYFRGHIIQLARDDFHMACVAMATTNAHDPIKAIHTLADHLDEVIEQQDDCIGIVANGVYANQERTRDQAVVETQAWALAFSEEGNAFARERGFYGSMVQLIEWLGIHYPMKVRRDPIKSWRKQANALRFGKSAHRALAHYHSIMMETAAFREMIEEAAGAAEREIDTAIDRMRGK